MNEQNDALLRVRNRQIAPAVKRAQIEARKTINKHFKSLRDALAEQHVKLGVQQARDIGQSNTAVATEFESQAQAAANRNQLATVIARTDLQERTL